MATEKLNEGLIKPGTDAIGGESRGGTELFLTCLSPSPTFLLQIVSAKDSERCPPASAAVTKNTFQVSRSFSLLRKQFQLFLFYFVGPARGAAGECSEMKKTSSHLAGPHSQSPTHPDPQSLGVTVSAPEGWRPRQMRPPCWS